MNRPAAAAEDEDEPRSRRHSRALELGEDPLLAVEEEEGEIAAGMGVPVEAPLRTVQQAYAEEGRFRGRMGPAYLYMEPVVLGLVVSSMAGVLIRVHATRLLTFAGQPIYALAGVQMLGCFIMGICMRTRGVLLRLSPALGVAMTTGLCGSITTFSSWQLLVFQQFFNTDAQAHTWLKNLLGGIAVLVSTVACAMGALRVGQMTGDEARLAINRYLRASRAEEPDPLRRINTKLLGGTYASGHRGWFGWDRWRTTDLVLVVAGIASLVAAVIVVALARSTRSVSIALLFGPIGTLIRWRLASLNASWPGQPAALEGLPVGTLAANALGSAVLAIIHLLQTGGVVHPSDAACYVLAAMADGFCGCLTTVSTFAAELSALSRRHSVAYATVSVVATQCFFLFIDGIYFKTSVIDYAVC